METPGNTSRKTGPTICLVAPGPKFDFDYVRGVAEFCNSNICVISDYPINEGFDRFPDGEDQSKSRNEILNRYDSALFLNEGEEIAELSQDFNIQKIGYFDVVIDGFVSKEIRICHRSGYFKNPIMPEFRAKSDPKRVGVIVSKGQKGCDRGAIKSWYESNRINPDAKYHWCYQLLRDMNYDEFIVAAEEYLFENQSKSESSIMMRYHMSQALLSRGFVKKSLINVSSCLAENFLMAEFWCLIGDIHVVIGDVEKAMGFYRNAIIFGEQRPKEDMYPIELAKYREYPERKLSACRKKIADQVASLRSNSLTTTVT